MASYAIISDVHANLEALYAVLEHIAKERIDRILFLGDSVGYGPDPNECVELLNEKSDILLAGNHDYGATGMTDISSFNVYARIAIEWTTGTLSEENKKILQELPLTGEVKDDGICLVHATPKEPEKWHYLSYAKEARPYFRYFNRNVCFVGHSHLPFIAERTPFGRMKVHDEAAEIKQRSRYIVNAGSVGQPRDGNPDAAYVLFRGNTLEIKRVSYDIVVTQKKMRKAGLPEYLINRLSNGR